MEIKFRLLHADEIEVRIGQIVGDGKGVSLLLFKDSRVDMNMLDETVGTMRWKRAHDRDNANCIVSIFDDDIKEWVSKEDTGTESNTEKEKGLASDSFKRACVNWGIGRELYSAPKIIVWGDPKQLKYVDFDVKEIGYDENRRINKLVITDGQGNTVYDMNAKKKKPETTNAAPASTKSSAPKVITDAQRKRLFAISNGNNEIVKKVITKYGYQKTEEIKATDYEKICSDVEDEINIF